MKNRINICPLGRTELFCGKYFAIHVLLSLSVVFCFRFWNLFFHSGLLLISFEIIPFSWWFSGWVHEPSCLECEKKQVTCYKKIIAKPFVEQCKLPQRWHASNATIETSSFQTTKSCHFIRKRNLCLHWITFQKLRHFSSFFPTAEARRKKKRAICCSWITMPEQKGVSRAFPAQSHVHEAARGNVPNINMAYTRNGWAFHSNRRPLSKRWRWLPLTFAAKGK